MEPRHPSSFGVSKAISDFKQEMYVRIGKGIIGDGCGIVLMKETGKYILNEVLEGL